MNEVEHFNIEVYYGIIRKDHPDWLGWTIIDLLSEKPHETEEHKYEIKVQLDYEVKCFFLNKE